MRYKHTAQLDTGAPPNNRAGVKGSLLRYTHIVGIHRRITTPRQILAHAQIKNRKKGAHFLYLLTAPSLLCRFDPNDFVSSHVSLFFSRTRMHAKINKKSEKERKEKSHRYPHVCCKCKTKPKRIVSFYNNVRALYNCDV